jgi:hypothetical protein
MPLDPVIAQGFRGIELQNPLDAYARVQQIQSAQQQNQLNALKMQEYQRENATNNALNQAYQAAYNPDTGAYDMNRLRGEVIRGGAGAKLPGIEEGMSKLRTQQFAQGKAETELADTKLKQARSFLDTINPADPNAPQQYIAWHESNHRDPVLGPLLASRGITADQSRARIAQAIQQGPQAFAELIAQSKLGTEKFMEMNKPSTQVIDQGGQRQVVQIPGLGGAPTTVGTYADVPLPADVAAQKVATALAGRPQVTVKLPEQEKEERGARGKLLVKQYEGISDAARLAGRTLPALETQERILDSGFKTGFGTEAQKAGASFLSAIGVPEATKYATDAQTFLAATQQAVLQRQLEQKGAQTEADAARITQTGAQLGNTADANKFIVSVAKAQLKRDIEQRNFYDKWWKENKTYDGAEDAWLTGQGGKSLFEAPELKKYTATAKPAPAAPRGRSAVQDQADAILRGGK